MKSESPTCCARRFRTSAHHLRQAPVAGGSQRGDCHGDESPGVPFGIWNLKLQVALSGQKPEHRAYRGKGAAVHRECAALLQYTQMPGCRITLV
jgi:hypothetical protein